jgi:hypothetical protein
LFFSNLQTNKKERERERERGLHELKKLGIESQLWDATRRAPDDDF